jgi:hypothetical protein
VHQHASMAVCAESRLQASSNLASLGSANMGSNACLPEVELRTGLADCAERVDPSARTMRAVRCFTWNMNCRSKGNTRDASKGTRETRCGRPRAGKLDTSDAVVSGCEPLTGRALHHVVRAEDRSTAQGSAHALRHAMNIG